MHKIKHLLLGALVTLGVQTAGAEELIREFEGRGDQVTAEFEVTGPWLLTWRVSSDFPGRIGFEANLIEATSRRHHGLVKKVRDTGAGFKLFRDTGRFRFKINSSFADWFLRVEELTEEEAAEYQPIQRGGLRID